MPELKNGRQQPGLFITSDKRYLYCYKGTTFSGKR